MAIYLYILADPDKPAKTKIGITKNPKQRIKSYRTSAPGSFFSALYVIPDKIHEKKILDILKDRFRVQSEYIHCQPKLVQNIIESYLIDNDIVFA